MKIISHRGESKYATENTMSAFYLAYLLKSDGIECDVRKTKDNKLVLMHDKTIDRISKSKGKISDYNYEDLVKIKLNDNENIVLLDEFLKYFSNKNIILFIEIKEKGYEKLIIDLISKYNSNNITLISFKYEVLNKLREYSNNIKLGWLVHDISNNIIDNSKKINISNILCNSLGLNKNVVNILKNNNLLISAWGIKNKLELSRIGNLNIDYIICDSYYDAKGILNV